MLSKSFKINLPHFKVENFKRGLKQAFLLFTYFAVVSLIVFFSIFYLVGKKLFFTFSNGALISYERNKAFFIFLGIAVFLILFFVFFFYRLLSVFIILFLFIFWASTFGFLNLIQPDEGKFYLNIFTAANILFFSFLAIIKFSHFFKKVKISKSTSFFSYLSKHKRTLFYGWFLLLIYFFINLFFILFIQAKTLSSSLNFNFVRRYIKEGIFAYNLIVLLVAFLIFWLFFSASVAYFFYFFQEGASSLIIKFQKQEKKTRLPLPTLFKLKRDAVKSWFQNKVSCFRSYKLRKIFNFLISILIVSILFLFILSIVNKSFIPTEGGGGWIKGLSTIINYAQSSELLEPSFLINFAALGVTIFLFCLVTFIYFSSKHGVAAGLTFFFFFLFKLIVLLTFSPFLDSVSNSFFSFFFCSSFLYFDLLSLDLFFKRKNSDQKADKRETILLFLFGAFGVGFFLLYAVQFSFFFLLFAFIYLFICAFFWVIKNWIYSFFEKIVKNRVQGIRRLFNEFGNRKNEEELVIGLNEWHE